MITPEFLETYDAQIPPWGFGGMGEATMLRTYSRPIKGLDRNETWLEVCTRAVNGAVDIGAELSKEDAEKLFDHMYNLRASVSGRALWQLGTPLVERMGGASLQNCYFSDVEKIEDFEFIFQAYPSWLKKIQVLNMFLFDIGRVSVEKGFKWYNKELTRENCL